MSREDSPIMSQKTWARTLEPVTKIGYMEGASNGQASVYQNSFDVGYEQGFEFGLEIGFKEATLSTKQKGTTVTNVLVDQRKINCQMCLNTSKSQENIVNLNNNQKKKNVDLLRFISANTSA